MGLLELLGNCVSKRAMDFHNAFAQVSADPFAWTFDISYYFATLAVENPLVLALFVHAGNDFPPW